MQKKIGTQIKPITYRVVSFALLVGVAAVFSACSGMYGSYKRDAEIYHAFQANQVNPNYTYYFNGVGNQVYAIIGLEPKYRINSVFWREVKPDTDKFKTLVNQIWEDYGYRTYGADLLDPAGQKIGIVYSSIYGVTTKFLKNNQIEVMLNTPFLWGPGNGHGGPRNR